MRFEKTVTLKDGRSCFLRNADLRDGEKVLALFIATHEQTDFLLTYPDENTMSVLDEAKFLQEKTESSNEIEILAVVDDMIVGTAGIESIGSREKIRHRADFGISVDEEFWGLGIGRALTEACISCAREAGYAQLELSVVAENTKAIRLYEGVGFTEYGRNPRGFRSRISGWQKVVLMRYSIEG